MTEQPSPLKPLPENWGRALAIVAHPDDMEFGAAAAVARWTGQGKQIGYVMITSGEAGIDGLAPDECKVVREQEQVEGVHVAVSSHGAWVVPGRDGAATLQRTWSRSRTSPIRTSGPRTSCPTS